MADFMQIWESASQPVYERYECDEDGEVTESGDLKHYYSPLNHPEVLFALESVKTDRDALGFVCQWGLPGHVTGWTTALAYESYVDPDEWDGDPEWSGSTLVNLAGPNDIDAPPRARESAREWRASASLGHVLHHAETIRLLLALVRSLGNNEDPTEIMSQLKVTHRREGWMVVPLRLARGQGFYSEIGLYRGTSAADAARTVIAEVVGGNLEKAPLTLGWNGSKGTWQFGPAGDLIHATYWHLANLIRDAKLITRCDECGMLFESTRKGQRYCPPLQGKTDSACALRARQKRFRTKAETGVEA